MSQLLRSAVTGSCEDFLAFSIKKFGRGDALTERLANSLPPDTLHAVLSSQTVDNSAFNVIDGASEKGLFRSTSGYINVLVDGTTEQSTTSPVELLRLYVDLRRASVEWVDDFLGRNGLATLLDTIAIASVDISNNSGSGMCFDDDVAETEKEIKESVEFDAHTRSWQTIATALSCIRILLGSDEDLKEFLSIQNAISIITATIIPESLCLVSSMVQADEDSDNDTIRVSVTTSPLSSKAAIFSTELALTMLAVLARVNDDSYWLVYIALLDMSFVRGYDTIFTPFLIFLQAGVVMNYEGDRLANIGGNGAPSVESYDGIKAETMVFLSVLIDLPEEMAFRHDLRKDINNCCPSWQMLFEYLATSMKSAVVAKVVSEILSSTTETQVLMGLQQGRCIIENYTQCPREEFEHFLVPHLENSFKGAIQRAKAENRHEDYMLLYFGFGVATALNDWADLRCIPDLDMLAPRTDILRPFEYVSPSGLTKGLTEASAVRPLAAVLCASIQSSELHSNQLSKNKLQRVGSKIRTQKPDTTSSDVLSPVVHHSSLSTNVTPVSPSQATQQKPPSRGRADTTRSSSRSLSPSRNRSPSPTRGASVSVSNIDAALDYALIKPEDVAPSQPRSAGLMAVPSLVVDRATSPHSSSVPTLPPPVLSPPKPAVPLPPPSSPPPPFPSPPPPPPMMVRDVSALGKLSRVKSGANTNVLPFMNVTITDMNSSDASVGDVDAKGSVWASLDTSLVKIDASEVTKIFSRSNRGAAADGGHDHSHHNKPKKAVLHLVMDEKTRRLIDIFLGKHGGLSCAGSVISYVRSLEVSGHRESGAFVDAIERLFDKKCFPDPTTIDEIAAKLASIPSGTDPEAVMTSADIFCYNIASAIPSAPRRMRVLQAKRHFLENCNSLLEHVNGVINVLQEARSSEGMKYFLNVFAAYAVMFAGESESKCRKVITVFEQSGSNINCALTKFRRIKGSGDITLLDYIISTMLDRVKENNESSGSLDSSIFSNLEFFRQFPLLESSRFTVGDKDQENTNSAMHNLRKTVASIRGAITVDDVMGRYVAPLSADDPFTSLTAGWLPTADAHLIEVDERLHEAERQLAITLTYYNGWASASSGFVWEDVLGSLRDFIFSQYMPVYVSLKKKRHLDQRKARVLTKTATVLKAGDSRPAIAPEMRHDVVEEALASRLSPKVRAAIAPRRRVSVDITADAFSALQNSATLTKIPERRQRIRVASIMQKNSEALAHPSILKLMEASPDVNLLISAKKADMASTAVAALALSHAHVDRREGDVVLGGDLAQLPMSTKSKVLRFVSRLRKHELDVSKRVDNAMVAHLSPTLSPKLARIRQESVDSPLANSTSVGSPRLASSTHMPTVDYHFKKQMPSSLTKKTHATNTLEGFFDSI